MGVIDLGLLDEAFPLVPYPVPAALGLGDASWSALALQLAWALLVHCLAVLACLAFSQPYKNAAAGARRGGGGPRPGPARRPGSAEPQPADTELADLRRGVAQPPARVAEGAKVVAHSLGALAGALSPEQLATRLRREVETLVGTEARRGVWGRGGRAPPAALSAFPPPAGRCVRRTSRPTAFSSCTPSTASTWCCP